MLTLGERSADPDPRPGARAGAGGQQPNPGRGAQPDLVASLRAIGRRARRHQRLPGGPGGRRPACRSGRRRRSAAATSRRRRTRTATGHSPARRRRRRSTGRGPGGSSSSPARPRLETVAMFPFALLILAICLQAILLGVTFACSGVAAGAAARAVSLGNNPQAAVGRRAARAGCTPRSDGSGGGSSVTYRPAPLLRRQRGDPRTSRPSSRSSHTVVEEPQMSTGSSRRRPRASSANAGSRPGHDRVHGHGAAGAGGAGVRAAGDDLGATPRMPPPRRRATAPGRSRWTSRRPRPPQASLPGSVSLVRWRPSARTTAYGSRWRHRRCCSSPTGRSPGR